jgi:hypothetical protein
MDSLLALRAVNCGFKPQSDHTKDYKSDICCFNAKNAALRLAQNQDNVSE